MVNMWCGRKSSGWDKGILLQVAHIMVQLCRLTVHLTKHVPHGAIQPAFSALELKMLFLWVEPSIVSRAVDWCAVDSDTYCDFTSTAKSVADGLVRR